MEELMDGLERSWCSALGASPEARGHSAVNGDGSLNSTLISEAGSLLSHC